MKHIWKTLLDSVRLHGFTPEMVRHGKTRGSMIEALEPSLANRTPRVDLHLGSNLPCYATDNMVSMF